MLFRCPSSLSSSEVVVFFELHRYEWLDLKIAQVCSSKRSNKVHVVCQDLRPEARTHDNSMERYVP